MRKSLLLPLAGCLLSLPATLFAAAAEPNLEALRNDAMGRSESALAEVRELCAVAPGRLAGSKAFERALAWAEAKFAAIPGAKVWRQEMMVPLWRRGRPAEARLLSGPDREPLTLLALGFSGATPAGGLRAEVLEVSSLAALQQLGRERVSGKIVFFNRPMELDAAGHGTGYGGAVDQRSRGPALAGRLGAVAALVRSVTPAHDDHPHVGMTRFAAGQPPLPGAALGVLSAERLSRVLHAAPTTELQLFIDAENGPAVASANLVVELRGREKPGEVLLVGGHLDSWDVAPGAHDNAAGVVQSLEVFRMLAKAPGPRHTLRCVLFTSEEIGALGGIEYARRSAAEKVRHVFAVELDAGGFAPSGFDFGPKFDPELGNRVARAWGGLLEPFGVRKFTANHGGTDVGPLQAQGAGTAYMRTDAYRYFLIHHAPSDIPNIVDARELQAGAAATAALLSLVDTLGLP